MIALSAIYYSPNILIYLLTNFYVDQQKIFPKLFPPNNLYPSAEKFKHVKNYYVSGF